MISDPDFQGWLAEQTHRGDSVGEIARIFRASKERGEDIQVSVNRVLDDNPLLHETIDALGEFGANCALIPTPLAECERLNIEAEEVFEKNVPLFLGGICRLFHLWVQISIHSRKCNNPRYAPSDELRGIYKNLYRWIKEEGSILDPSDLSLSVFSSSFPPPANPQGAEQLIGSNVCEYMYETGALYFLEILLQHLLRRNGWTTLNVYAWCNQPGEDRPGYAALFQALKEFTPNHAISISSTMDFTRYKPDYPVIARPNGFQDTEDSRFSPVLLG